MYFARILFFCEKGLKFNNLSDNPIELFQKDNYKCTATSKIQGEKIKVIIEYGGFETREKANTEGINLLRNIKLEMCKDNNPINISGINGILDCKEQSVIPSRFTKEGLELIKSKLVDIGKISKDKIVMEDVLGLEIYEVVSSMNEIYFVTQDIQIKYSTDFKIKKQDFKYWDEKLDVALSFLNTSILINDVRIRFLLKIMVIEVLVSEKEYNEENYTKIINDIIKNINSNDELMSRIKNDIGQLKVKSIGKKCKDLIERYCNGRKYCDLDALKFFNNCYKMRSKLVHSGEIDLQELIKFDEPLKNLIIYILESISINNVQ